MRNMWEKYYDDANAIVFVVDASDMSRLEEAILAYGAVTLPSTTANTTTTTATTTTNRDVVTFVYL